MSTNAPVIRNAVMLDRVIGEIQEGLIANLDWLDVAFGRAQRLTKMMEDRKIITPNVFCGGWSGHGDYDYIEVSPDSKIGNFSFFDVEDPQTITPGPWAREIKVPFGLVFWFDLTRVYNEENNRNIELLKAQALRVLNGRAGWYLDKGRITINRIYDRAENIYRGYNISEIDNQFLMHPFGGFRLEGVLEFEEVCFTDVAPTPELKTMSIGGWGLGEKFGTVKIQRILGNSAILDGTLRNNRTDSIETYGSNLFDRSIIMEGTWEFGGESGFEYVLDNVHVCSGAMYIQPGQRYYIHAPGLQGHMTIKAYGPNAQGVYNQFPDNILDFSEIGYEQMAIIVDKEFADLLNGVCINISNPLLDGHYYDYWREVVRFSIPLIQGRRNGTLRTIFWDGLKSCGDVFDEIVGNKAIQRVGNRVYLPGDEDNDEVLTDGQTTNYILDEPLEWEILPIEDTFKMALNGYIFRTPDTYNTDLIIEYYDN